MRIDSKLKGLIPKLKPSELAALEHSIQEEGCRDPLTVWCRPGKDDVLVDGHNRKEICDRLGVEYDVVEMEFNDRQEVLDWMLRHQLTRRNLSTEAAADVIGQIYNQRKKKHGGDRASSQNGNLKTCDIVAEELGVGKTTVNRHGDYAAALGRLTDVLDVCRDDLRAGEFVKDGEESKGRKLRINDVVTLADDDVSDADVKAVWKKLTDAGDTCNSVKAALRELKNDKAAKKIKKTKDKLVDVRLGNFVDIADELPDASVDIIITDPPYPHEFIEVWSDLSKVASRILKPHGLCIAYSGKLHLDECMRRLGEHLSFYWQIMFLQTVSPAVHPRRVNTKYKPILIYQNVPEGGKVEAHKFSDGSNGKYFFDVIEGGQVEKDAHEWQQSADGVEKLIEEFTLAGDLIFEPFSGGGTTPLVAKHMNRRCIACEIDKKAYKGSVARVFGEDQ